jgi:hypothetical protein
LEPARWLGGLLAVAFLFGLTQAASAQGAVRSVHGDWQIRCDTPPGAQGERIVDDSFYLVFNAAADSIDFRLPDSRWGRRWQLEVDTRCAVEPEPAQFDAGDRLTVDGRALLLLRRLD